MSEQDPLNPAERELEAALRSLTPIGAQLDPVAAAFDAGQRSCRRQVRVWQSAAAAALLLLGTGLWIAPAARSPVVAPQDNSNIAQDTPAPPKRLVTDQSLIMLRAAVAEHGLDALPRVQVPATEQIWVGEAISTPR